MTPERPAPCQMLYDFIAAPPVAEAVTLPVAALCWVCAGTTTRAVAQKDWAGSSYTGQTKVRCPSSAWVCEACVYLHSRITPVPGRPAAPGKKFGGNFRNYSHLFERTPDGATYENASKGEKPIILAFLRRPKRGLWFGAIADSGQKHVIPWAPVNGPGIAGKVLFDDTTVTLPEAPGFVLVSDMAALLTAGAVKGDSPGDDTGIATGSYSPVEWSRCPEAIRAFEARWSAARHSAWFRLALWLAQRDEIAVAERLTRTRAKAPTGEECSKKQRKNASAR